MGFEDLHLPKKGPRVPKHEMLGDLVLSRNNQYRFGDLIRLWCTWSLGGIRAQSLKHVNGRIYRGYIGVVLG